MAVAFVAMISCPANSMMARILAVVDWKDLTPFPPVETMLKLESDANMRMSQFDNICD